MHRTTSHEAPPAAGPWPPLAKAQAHALKAALGRQGTPVQLGHALELRAHLAGYESWNHYRAALQTGTGFVNDLTRVTPGAAVEDALRHAMQAAGAEVLYEALAEVGGGLQVFEVTGTALNFRTLHEQLAAVDEVDALDALFDARPQFIGLDEDRELLLLLGRLCDEEGPGLLAHLQAEGGSTWAYLAGATTLTALGFALAHAALPETPDAYDGPREDGQFTFARSGALARRTRLPTQDTHGPADPFLAQVGRWWRLWTSGEGRAERIDQLRRRLPAGYPAGRSLPPETSPLAAHVAFADALELHALQARQDPGQVVDWREGLPQEALQALLKDVRLAVQAAAEGQSSRFPPLAGVEIRSAIAAGLTLREVTEEVKVLLEDALPFSQIAPPPAVTWVPVRRLKDVQVGDRLRVNRGQPFVVQAVLGVRQFELGVIDHRGLPWDISDTDDLQRLRPDS